MNILQISAPKSGSYWLHSILKQTLQKKNLPQESFIRKQEIHQELKEKELSFKGQAGVDMLDIEEDGCYYRVSSIFRERIEDIDRYTNSTNLAWTHSTYCSRSPEVFSLFDKKICIIRDPRDRALSSAKFRFKPYMKDHYPSSHSSPEEYLEEEYERLLEQWVWYTGNYLLHQEELDLHFVFYERLLNDFQAELQNLLSYLELNLSASGKTEIEEAVSFSNMKDKSPKHLQKGKFGKWIHQLNDEQKKVAVEKAGYLMKLLNYPLNPKDGQQLPKMPAEIDRDELEKRLQQIEWPVLFP